MTRKSIGWLRRRESDLRPWNSSDRCSMAMIQIPPDFKEFLKLLNEMKVEYLVVGGYAVGYHGYIRATGDMDIWVAPDANNANRTISALREFGFEVPDSAETLLLVPDNILRMGIPPVRIE